MGCGGCGGGHDPFAAYRNKGERMSKGTLTGVTKSEKRLTREKAGKAAPDKKKAKVKAPAELPTEIPASGVIKSKKRLAREKKAQATSK